MIDLTHTMYDLVMSIKGSMARHSFGDCPTGVSAELFRSEILIAAFQAVERQTMHVRDAQG
jgi:hypothetical protein